MKQSMPSEDNEEARAEEEGESWLLEEELDPGKGDQTVAP
jgi:hypothetical protein